MRLPPADVNMKFVGIYVHNLNHVSVAAHPLTKAAIEPGTKLGFCTMDGGQNQMRSKCGAKMKKPRPHVTGRWSQRQRWLRSKDAIDHTTNNPSPGLYTQQRLRHNGLVRGSARWIRSCSTKKTLRLQSRFDAWLTRFQIRIDKMCTNLYKFCKTKFRTLICDIHHSEQEFTRTKLQNKWIATVVEDGNYVMHQKAIISHQLQNA